jgi:S1-C subfamily serine protease
MSLGLDAPPPSISPRPGRVHGVGRRLRKATPFVAGILAAFIGIELYGALNPGPRQLNQGDVNDTIARVLASQTPGPPLSELAYEQVRPSLVLIETDGTDAKGAATHSLGSGVVVNTAGEVLTALHVVAGATAIHLTFADGTTAGAALASSQPTTDIAVLQPDRLPATVVPATLGNPGAAQVGSDAFVVGNPFGLYGSMSAGVVSGLNRSFHDPNNADRVFSGLIQVDAAVNPGNSGGPLLDGAGRVIGIVIALVNPTKEDVFVGIGLAVPINVAGGAAGLPQD